MTGLGVRNIPDIAFSYWGHVDMMIQNPGLYGMDSMREKLHEALCESYSLTKEESKRVTNHMNKYETAVALHFALLDLKTDKI